MRNILLSNWNFLRITRLVLGVILIVQALQQQFWAAGLLGGLLLFQAITNTGCCGSAGCAVRPSDNRKKGGNLDSVEYDEVK
ncbi:MAG: hypothetical protein BGN92_10250 [Sphingobacteriales bacterium 41-5]|nr:MAG: hypothetical protein ABS67_03785 [Niabella sp. SCN 42-15]OJU24850.1 MAG: hypothetical protein BGN92_10250 [Sphingobacteriales bacterium 41-5]